MGLEGTALEQVNPVIPIFVEVAGILHIHRIVIFLLENGHYPGHSLGKVGTSEHTTEIEDEGGGFVVNAQFPVSGYSSHVRLHEQGGVGAHILSVQLLQSPVGKGIVAQVYKVNLVLGVFVLVPVVHYGRGQGLVQVYEPGVILRLPVHGPGAHAEDQAQHALVALGGGDAVHIQVLGVSHSRHMGVVVAAVAVAADPHHQQSHLLVPVQEVSLYAVFVGLLADGAGIDLAHRRLELAVALVQRPLVGAEHAVILSGKGVAEAVFQQGAGADYDGRLAEVLQHGQKLLLYGGHEAAV